jgi:acetyl-CoA carboxylase carboxyl transferase subunit alpha
MTAALDFERPLADLRRRLETLEKQLAEHASDELALELRSVETELASKTEEVYGGLTRWQKVQVARHPQRPQTLEYAKAICTDFAELHGDRFYGDDKAIVGGPARLDGRVVMIVGNQHGHETKDRIERNFGKPHPEGYRKALRLFRQAEKFGMPVLTFVDTPGASPFLEDEERGQAWALAENLAALAALRVPVICTIIGQGGSGGALALALGDRLLMLEHSVFSVSMPEAAASMLWRDAKFGPQAAEALKLTAQDHYELGLIDRIVPEPSGGAHTDAAAAAALLREALLEELDTLERRSVDELLAERYEKYRRIGAIAAA